MTKREIVVIIASFSNPYIHTSSGSNSILKKLNYISIHYLTIQYNEFITTAANPQTFQNNHE
jgi:hypothetical protein